MTEPPIVWAVVRPDGSIVGSLCKHKEAADAFTALENRLGRPAETRPFRLVPVEPTTQEGEG